MKNSYELLLKLTDDGNSSTIYVPDYRMSIPATNCDFGIKRHKHTGKYYINKNLKMPPEFLVHSLMRYMYDLGRKKGHNEKASEIRNALGLQ